jgi:hypothetical protein
MVKNLIKKYFKRIYPSVVSGKIIKSFSGWFLPKSNDMDYFFKQKLIEEIQLYCQEQGYPSLDKILFTSFYDVDMKNEEIYQNKKIKAESETQIDIIEINGKNIAIVCFGEYFSITKIN